MSALLAVRGLSKRFGGLVALDRVEFQVAAGELVGLIGPNGSGKTTLLNLLSGFYAADAGDAVFDGMRIGGRTPADLSRLGIARSFQVTKVFRRLSVLENLLVPGLVAWRTSRREASQRACAILERLDLARLADQRAANLSGGQAKLLEFGRLMMLEPRLVLLDEPFGGVHPDLKRLMYETIRTWNADGAAIALISHDMGAIFGLCRRVLVLRNGELIADGDAARVRDDPQVLEAYLGDRHAAGSG
ncbi:MAG TPA: ABC transporter ATP-binding protein [Geminicoccaceae bacterium]|nr:ABC transporter ATP-binding protein [Geminicoccaceae bacterium]